MQSKPTTRRTAPTAAQQTRQRELRERDLDRHAATYDYWPRYRERTEFVYLVAEWADGALTGYAKIGRAIDPVQRVRGLRTGNPRPLTIEGLILGSAAVERAFHKRWRNFGMEGEWFGVGCLDFLRIAFDEIDRIQRGLDPYLPQARLEEPVHSVLLLDFTEAGPVG